MVQIYHNSKFLDYWGPNPKLNFSDCVLVGEIPTDDLNVAWRESQNIDEVWNVENPCRSSSVGDVFVLSGVKYVVESVGFKILDDCEANV